MIRTDFCDDWTVGVKQNEFAEAGGGSSRSPVRLPHDAMITTARSADAPGGAPNAYFHGGVWEYRKEFDAPAEWSDKIVALEFEGVYRSAVLTLNGAQIAVQANGYTGFVVELDRYLKPGQRNVLTVEARAHLDSRWYTGAGIYRPVHLLVADPVHITHDGVTVRTPTVNAHEATIEVSTVLTNRTRHLEVTSLETTILDAGGGVVLMATTPVSVLPGEDALDHQRFHLPQPALWSTERPHLYEVRSTLRSGDEVIDRSRETFGVRSIQVDPLHGLRINDTPVLLRGACVHHDNGILGAATIGRAEERRVELLKAAGFNALRASHQPMSRAMLQACDRLGVLVIDEAFDMWTRAKTEFDYSLDFEHGWQRDIEAMVVKDRNCPSVIAYSIGNEIPEVATAAGAAWSRRIATRVRQLDHTRFVTAAVNGALTVMAEVIASMAEQGGPPAEGLGINSFLTQMAEHNNAIGASDLVTNRTAEAFSTLDIAGMNYLDGRYEQDVTQFPHRVIVGTETFPTRIDILWDLVRRLPHVIGDFTWTGWDYLGEVGIGRTIPADEEVDGILAPFPWLTAWAGDLDITGFRRPASYYREIVFGLRSTPYIAVQNPATHSQSTISGPWSWGDSTGSWTWPAYDGKPVRVEVYSDADEVELTLNGRVIERQPAGPGHRFRAVFDLLYEPGELVAVNYRDGAAAERATLTTAGAVTQVSIDLDRTRIEPGSESLVFVAIALLDAHGRPVPDDASITLEVDGPADLAGFGSGAPSTTESFHALTHTSFRGRALAALRPRSTGTVSLTARVADLAPATAAVEIVPVENLTQQEPS